MLELKSREALRAHVSITFPDETASADAFENSWLSRPYESPQRAGTGISSAASRRPGAAVHLHERMEPMERIGCSWTRRTRRWKIHGGEPLRVSPDGRLLLFEVKEGGNARNFKLSGHRKPGEGCRMFFPGHLRGFAFAPDGKSFCYVRSL